MTSLLGAWALFLLVALWASCLATLRHFRKAKPLSKPLAEKITVIRPIRGLNKEMREALESLAESDPGKKLQVLIALESSDDPAYPVVLEFANAHKDRDVSVILTGASKKRMGKIHNMIEALPKAAHPWIVFSDADARASATLLQETSRAFAEGYDAVFALPYFSEPRNAAELSFAIALNHGFSTPAALSYHVLRFPFCAGAWMGFSNEILKKIGGLEPLAHNIADDYSLGQAVLKARGRCAFISQPVFFRENTESIKDTVQHLSKWASIIHSCLSPIYAFALFFSPAHAAALFLFFSWASGIALGPAWLLLGLTVFSRILVGLIQDARIARKTMPLYAYLGIPIFDFAATFIWLSGFREQINWRNKRYQLSPGCRSEVISEQTPEAIGLKTEKKLGRPGRRATGTGNRGEFMRSRTIRIHHVKPGPPAFPGMAKRDKATIRRPRGIFA